MSDELVIVAIITVRNGEPYVRRCLDHLKDQGVEAIIVDNDSSDGTRPLAEEYLGKGVLAVERLPFEGEFDLWRHLEHKEQIIRDTPADWFIHQDIDEIREAPKPFRTLREGIEEADRRGYNAINFDEFVFLPTSADEDHAGGDYVATMKHYYLFEPAPLRRINAFKPEGDFDLKPSGGHHVRLPQPRLFPQSFILRHYIALSREHLVDQYVNRVYRSDEVRRGWHGFRPSSSPESIILPDPASLKTIQSDGDWDRSDPKWRHQFLGAPGPQDFAQLERAASAQFRRMARQVGRLNLDLEALRGQVEVQRKELERIEEDREKQRVELDRAGEERRRVAQVRRAYESTLSWRLTRPLRAVRRLLRFRCGSE